MLDLFLLEPGYTSFYKKAVLEEIPEFSKNPFDGKNVDKMENNLSEIYSPEDKKDNFWFLAKL